MNEYLKLLSIVAAPLILILMLAILLYQNRHSDRIDTTFMAYNTAFDPYHGLASQPIFWMTIAYPIGLFFSTGFWAWYDYNLSITAEGFIKFIEISKLSLGLLGLSIPLAVLTARLHGTKQTALQINKTQSQIKETQQKNKTDLYLAHYKHFCDHINELEKKWLKRTFSHMKSSTKVTQFTINKKKCYDILYPESSLHNGISTISSILYDQQIKLITDSLDRWIYVLDNKDLDIKTFKELLLYSSHCIQMLFSNLCLNEIPSEQFINKGTFPKKDREEFFVLRPDQFNEFFDLFSYILMDIYSFESRKSMHMNDNDEVVQRIVLLHEKTKETGQLLSKHINYLGRAYDPMKKLDWSDLD